jgi:flagellar export protein FliJ
MKKFSFRLQRILDLRGAREKQRLSEFGQQQQILKREHDKLDLFHGEQQAQLEEMQLSRAQEFAAWSFQAGQRYVVRIGRVLEMQTQRVHGQEKAVEAARETYLAARRDTSVLEHLRERRREEWEKMIVQEEGKVLDEVGLRRHERQVS